MMENIVPKKILTFVLPVLLMKSYKEFQIIKNIVV